MIRPRSINRGAHEEVKATLQCIANIANLEVIPALPTSAWKMGSVWEKAWKNGKDAGRQFSRSLKSDDKRRSFLVAIKAGLIVSDSVASGLVPEVMNCKKIYIKRA